MSAFSQTLRHRVVIQTRAAGSGPEGEKIEVWTPFASPWVDIKIGNGMETIRAGAVSSKVQASIRIRFRSDLNAGMRVVHGFVIYNVLAVLPDLAGRRHVDLACEVVS